MSKHPDIPPDDDYGPEEDATPGRWEALGEWLRSWKGLLTVACLALAIAAIWNARTLYGLAKLWRARRLIALAQTAGRRGDQTGEFQRLREAFVLSPEDPATIRATARYSERLGDPSALAFYERLLSTGRGTSDDRVRTCRLALRGGRTERGRALLDALCADPATRDLPAVLTLEAERLALAEEWEPAIKLARQAVGQASASGVEKLTLASLLLRRAERTPLEGRAPLQREALELLGALALQPDEAGEQALQALATLARQRPVFPPLADRDVAPWVQAGEHRTAVTARLRVALWDLHLAARPGDAKAIYAAFVSKFRTAELPERLEAARWLNQHGQHLLGLDLSSGQQRTSPEWHLVYLDGLAATGDWKKVLATLESAEKAPLSDALRALFALRARIELRTQGDTAAAWRDIQLLVQKEPPRDQLYIAQYAARMGQPREAAAIFRRLLEKPAGELLAGQSLAREERLACYLGVIRAAPDNAPAAEILPLFEQLLAEFPEMEEAANDRIYLRLLTGSVAPGMRESLVRLLQRNPALLAYRSTLALLELRAGNTVAAAQLYDGWEIDWKTAQDRFKVVRVAVLAASGRNDEAEPLRQAIDPKRLRPEEAALLSGSPQK